jgi:purine-nucleoside phosphorylase
MATTTGTELRLEAGLRTAGLVGFDIAVVLGSGLGAFAKALEDASSVPFKKVDGMPTSAVPGHGGRFVLGTLGGRRVLVQEGRVHLYEGRSPEEVTTSVRAFARLGCKGLLLTNAAGCLREDWAVPGLMRLSDHLNLQSRPPLRRGEQGRGTPYDAEFGATIDGAAQEAGIALEVGVYAATLGPSYETPAEVRMIGSLGAQAVGMSTVAEASVAWAAGMRVGAISCLSNLAAGLSATPLSHGEVVEAGARMSEDMVRLLTAVVVAG